MLSTFPRSSHALATDRGRGMAAGILVAALLLSVWLAWGCLARLALYEVADTARIEVGRAVHVAIVGASGAGKSSLVGTLLGWHRPTAGRVLIDGQVLDGQRLEQLRRHTAWGDPAVQLWASHLVRQSLAKLPDGLQSDLGESGSRLSGGEGQRVRFGRALLRPETRLVILDEAFRGLDRASRREVDRPLWVYLERTHRVFWPCSAVAMPCAWSHPGGRSNPFPETRCTTRSVPPLKPLTRR